MSTIQTNAILDASGGNTTTVNGVTPNDNVVYGRNYIINGAMEIDQRGTETGWSTGPSAVDRFRFSSAGSSALRMTVSQVTDSPSGFDHSIKGEVTTVAASSSDEYGILLTILELRDVLPLLWANETHMTLSFWVKSSVAGAFAINFNPDDTNSGGNGDRILYHGSYTINSVNTWEYKTITVPLSFLSSYAHQGNYSSQGLTLTWVMDVISGGTRDDGVLGWNTPATEARNAVTSTGVSLDNGFITNTGNTFQLTGVKLEAGSNATKFIHRSFTEELQLCQRYFITTNPDRLYHTSTSQNFYVIGTGYNARARYSYTYPVTMRTAPSGTLVDATGNGTVAVWHGATRIDYSGSWTFENTMFAASYYTDTTPTSTINGKGMMSYMGGPNDNHNHYLELDAEF